jgi:hypothetical protein
MGKIAHMTPDLPRELTFATAQVLWRRGHFRVGERHFVKVDAKDDTYSDGEITVYHDQQDSTAWAARKGGVRTGYYWTPECAVLEIIG